MRFILHAFLALWLAVGPAVQAAPILMGLRTVGGGGGPLVPTNLTSGSSASSPGTTASITLANNAVAYVWVGSASDAGNTVLTTTVANGTLANVTWTEVQAPVAYGGRRGAAAWRGVNTSGSSQSGTITAAATYNGTATVLEIMWVVDEWAGIDTTTPNGTSATATGTGTSATVTVTGTPDAGDFVAGVFIHTGGTSDMTIGAELSNELLELGSGTDVRRMLSAYDSTPDASPTPGVSWTGAEDYAAIAFIVNVAP